MTDQPSTLALSPTTPADAAFRHLTKVCAELALAEPLEGQSDIRPVWKFAVYLTKKLAVLARKLPDNVREQFGAEAITSILRLCLQETPIDTDQRKSWRTAYGLLLGLLAREGVPIQPLTVHAVAVGCGLWSLLQQMAYQASFMPIHVQPPAILTRGWHPQKEEMAQREQLMQLREMLIADWAEASMHAAGFVLDQRRAAQQAKEAAASAPAEGAPAEESPAS